MGRRGPHEPVQSLRDPRQRQDPSAWPGWCVSPKREALRNAWFNASDAAAQKKACQDMQLQCMVDMPSLPVGQFIQPTAYRSSLTGALPGFATFWNVRPA